MGDCESRRFNTAVVEPLERRRLFSGFQANINFQPPNLPIPSGYFTDTGAVFGDRGNGLTYGWNPAHPAVVRSVNVRPARAGPDARYDTFALLQHQGRGSSWSIAVPNGDYTVHLVVGNPLLFPYRYQVLANGTPILDGRATGKQPWVDQTAQMTVTDGTIALTAPRGTIDRLDFIDITQVVAASPPPPALPPAPPSPPVPPPPAAPLSLTWTQVTDSPTPRLEASAVTVGNLLYVFGGYGTDSPTYLATKETDSYDPATDTWTRLADMPEGLTHIGAATDGRYIYAAGGYVSNYSTGQQTFATTDTWRYDTVTNRWTAFVPLPAARSAGAMVIIGDELHYFDGNDINRNGTPDHWVLNLSDANPQWVASTPVPVASNHIAAAVLDGKIYAIGGQTGNDDAQPDADVFEWDPVNPGAWQTVASLPEPISHAVAVTVGNQIVLIDGATTGLVQLASVLSCDPTTNTWTTLSNALPAPREYPAADVVDNRIVVTTGDYFGLKAQTWVSQPITP